MSSDESKPGCLRSRWTVRIWFPHDRGLRNNKNRIKACKFISTLFDIFSQVSPQSICFMSFRIDWLQIVSAIKNLVSETINVGLIIAMRILWDLYFFQNVLSDLITDSSHFFFFSVHFVLTAVIERLCAARLGSALIINELFRCRINKGKRKEKSWEASLLSETLEQELSKRKIKSLVLRSSHKHNKWQRRLIRLLRLPSI